MSARTSLAERSQGTVRETRCANHATLALTALLLRRERSAEKHLRELDRCSPKVGPRFIALARALRALYITARTHLLREDLDAKLDRLSGLGFGGVSRLIRALPLASAATEPLSALTNAELRLVLALTDTNRDRESGEHLEDVAEYREFHLKPSIASLAAGLGRKLPSSLAGRAYYPRLTEAHTWRAPSPPVVAHNSPRRGGSLIGSFQ